MKKALVSVDTNLGSSIALRYVNHMANHFRPTLYAAHVVEPSHAGSEPGSGWVQKTWENALVESDREDLRRFLEMEQVTSPLLRNPKILVGDRTEQLLGEIQDGPYDLFLEGVPPTSNPMDFYALLKSRLYRSLPCPALVIKNLAPSDRIALLTGEHLETNGIVSSLLESFNISGFELDIIDIRSLEPVKPVVKVEDLSDPAQNKLLNALDREKVTPKALKQVQGAPRDLADMFREYGLVAAVLPYNPRKNDPFVELLGRIASPVLICRG